MSGATVSEHHDDPTDLASARAHFARFAAGHGHLPLYSAICRGAAQDDEAAGLLLAARPGQGRPVLWLAALHELVLRRPDLPAAQWFPSVVGRSAVPDGDPWPDVREAVLAHRDELGATIATRATQTNEVNRSTYLAAGLRLAARDLPDRPVVLVEMGASAGLLLGVDRYRVQLDGTAGPDVVGDPASGVHCSGVRRDDGAPLGALPEVAGRVGIDLEPVSLDDADALRWLEACLWPDVPGRVDRFRAAVATLAADPPRVLRGDMVRDLDALVRAAEARSPGAHVVVYSSWALTYVERTARPEVELTLDSLAREGLDLSWLTFEPPGCAPGIPVPDGVDEATGGTVVGLRTWRSGHAHGGIALGSCHPHGEWITLESGRTGQTS